jgi:bacteriorhodopsin
MDHIYLSAKWSLYFQMLFGIFAILILFIPIPKKDKIVWEVLFFDTIVQVIELIFYIWLTFYYVKIKYDITSTRYLDWFITTPIMLVTTILFIQYLDNKGEGKGMWDMIKDEWKTLIIVVSTNVLMLLFGLLGELGSLSRFYSFVLSFGFFFYTFYLIYNRYVKNRNDIDEESEKYNGDKNRLIFPIWLFMIVVWGMYGIAYIFPYQTKNTFYNILDIFSKNFYGLFIAFYIILSFYRSKISF